MKNFFGPIFCFFFLFACTRTPITGKRGVDFLSEDQEKSQGEAAYRDVLKKEKRSPNQALTAQVERVGQEIAAISGRSDFAWEFATLESPTPNAFCLPGGKVAVYTGLAPYAKNEAGLATVIGHEIGHALARHGGQRVTQAMGTNLALLVLGATTLKDNPQRDTIMAALGVGATLGVILPFSRSHESEADEIGIILMARAGYDPREAVEFWSRFSTADKGKSPPAFLSTHPPGAQRIKNLQALLAKAQVEYDRSPNKRGQGEALKI